MKYCEVRGVGVVKKFGGIEILNDFYVKIGYVNFGYKMNDENV